MSAAKKETNEQNTSATEELTESLEKVFLAGLGALSTATDFSAKTFESLVDQGQAYRKAASAKTEKLIEEVQDAVKDVTGGAQERATGLIDQVREQSNSNVTRLQDVFDSRVEGALRRLQVPTRSDIEALNEKLDTLIKLAEAGSKKPAAKKTASKKATTRKTKVAKKTAAK